MTTERTAKQRSESTTAASGESLTIPLVLALAAPLVVIVCIEYFQSVWWTFAIYQVGICLVAPALESRLVGRSWREHASLLGLLDPIQADGTRNGKGTSRWLKFGIVLGLITTVVTGGFLVLTHDHFLSPDRLNATVAGWGVSPEQVLLMLAFMAVINAPAEELFWRGYIPGRVKTARPTESRPSILLSVVLPAVLYASYHATTIGHLVGKMSGAIVMTAGVLAGGLIWGWLRQRTGSVWLPLLSHSGAVFGYLAVHIWLTG